MRVVMGFQIERVSMARVMMLHHVLGTHLAQLVYLFYPRFVDVAPKLCSQDLILAQDFWVKMTFCKSTSSWVSNQRALLSGIKMADR